MKNIIIAKSILPAVQTSGTLFGRGAVRLHTAATSEEILDLHRRIKADLIIAEFGMPVMNGARLCSAIRADAALKGVSIVLVCENSSVFQAACREAGANALVSKPVDPFDLFSKVAELIIVPQRKDLRVLLRVSVEGAGEGRPFFATSYNISVSGMLMEAKHELMAGDLLKCTFNIAHNEIIAECLVMRVERTDSGRFRYGIKFQNLAARALVIIEHFVKSRMQQK